MTEQGLERRLAGILSADVVGYSRLMAGDEAATIAAITSHRELIRRCASEHRGRVVDSPGDNVLAEFPTAVDALRAALAIQAEVEAANEGLEPDRCMRFRIGVHLGEVSVQDGRLYGDGVNIAARVEALAPPGGIAVSGTAYDVAHGKLDVDFEDTGTHSVKNLPDPVRVYRIGGSRRSSPRWRVALVLGGVVLIGALVLWLGGQRGDEGREAAGAAPLALPSGPALAVLPFDNLGGDPQQDYFSDGLTEDIITGLSRFQDVSVMARHSTFQYKRRAVDVRDVGRELGVHYVLEGSVRRDADTIRVTAQLLDARSGAHVWAETYDRALSASSLFEVQDDITGRVVSTIASAHGVLSRVGQARLRAEAPRELGSYECVLRSYEYEQLHTAASHLRARDCLENAVERDRGYVDAWAQLAYLYREEFLHDFNQRPGSLDRALATARHAVQLDETNQAAYYALAFAHFGRKEYEPFVAAAERAIALNPRNARIVGGLGVQLAFAGHWERGLALCRQALALNPARPWWLHLPAALDHYRKGEYEQALLEGEKISVRALPLVSATLAATYAQLGRPDEARSALAALLELSPEFARDPEAELGKFFASEELVAHLLEGLHEAGLPAGS